MYYLIVAVGQESRHSLGGCYSHLKIWLERICFLAYSHGCLQGAILHELFNQDLSSSWAVGWRCSLVPSCIDLLIEHLTTWQLAPSDEQESTNKLHFCNLTMEVSNHHFCCILFARNKLLGSAHTQGERITKECEYQEAGSLTAISEAAYCNPSPVHYSLVTSSWG